MYVLIHVANIYSFFFPSIMDNLRILQWNSRNFHTNFDEFKQFLDKNPCDVLCLQSVHRSANELPILEGYYYPPYYKLKDNGDVGIATYIKANIIVKKNRPPDENNLILENEIILNGLPFRIINCYYPEGLSKENVDWIGNLDNTNDQILIVGDFNAHHSHWNNSIIDSKRGGQNLYQNLIKSSLTLLNDGSITRIPDRNNDSCSAIDLAFISASLSTKSYWSIQDDTLGSDHLPIIINIVNDFYQTVEKELEIGFDTKKADWNLFQSLLYHNILKSENKTCDNVQQQYDKFRKCVLDAAEISIPKKCTEYKVRYGNEWWNEHCAVAVRDKKRAYHFFKRHECQETLDLYKKAKYTCKKIIADAKIEYLENYIERNIKDFKDATKLWNKIKKIKNRFHLPEQPLLINGKKTQSNQEKADILAQSFAKNGQSLYLSDEIKNYRLKEEEIINPIINNIEKESNSTTDVLFTKTEMMICIKQINDVKKATGSDFISYEMIKHFPQNAIEALLDIYNKCYKNGIIPNQWSKAEVKALPKKGKK